MNSNTVLTGLTTGTRKATDHGNLYSNSVIGNENFREEDSSDPKLEKQKIENQQLQLKIAVDNCDIIDIGKALTGECSKQSIAKISSAIHEEIVKKAYYDMAAFKEEEGLEKIKELLDIKGDFSLDRMQTGEEQKMIFSGFLMGLKIEDIADKIEELEEEKKEKQNENDKNKLQKQIDFLGSLKEACISRTILNSPYSETERLKIDLKTIFDHFEKKRVQLEKEKKDLQDSTKKDKKQQLINDIEALNMVLATLWAMHIDKLGDAKEVAKTWDEVVSRFGVTYEAGSKASTAVKAAGLATGTAGTALLSSWFPLTTVITQSSSWFGVWASSFLYLNPLSAGVLASCALGGLALYKTGEWLKKRNFLNDALASLKEPLYTFSLGREKDFKDDVSYTHFMTGNNTDNKAENVYLNCIKLDKEGNDLVFDTTNIHEEGSEKAKQQANRLWKIEKNAKQNEFIKAYFEKLDFEKEYWFLNKEAKCVKANEKERIEMRNKIIDPKDTDEKKIMDGIKYVEEEVPDGSGKKRHFYKFDGTKLTSLIDTKLSNGINVPNNTSVVK